MMQEVVQGLLIEGVDYAGKTAVADALARQLERGGHAVCRRQCFMNEHPIIERLLLLAKQHDRMDERDVCYTASILLDVALPQLGRAPGHLIQERHVQTQIARNSFFYEDDERWHVAELRRLRRRFSTQVYLTSDFATKSRRTRSREPKSPRDALLAADPELHQRFDDYMRETLPAGEPWLIIDTSLLNPEKVATLISKRMFSEDALPARRHG